jgi:DNA topoisomerase-2
MDLLFPRCDDFLLEYTYEDGEKCEPTFYIPIMPYSILETSTTVSVGWSILVWARDFNRVLDIVRYIINEEEIPTDELELEERAEKLNLEKYAWIPKNMKIIIGKYVTGKKISEICKGVYKYNEERNTILVTQLPLKIWSYNFCCSILGMDVKSGKYEDSEGNPYPKKELATDVIDHTANDRNHILIKLKDGAMEDIKRLHKSDVLDPIEEYFELSQQFYPQLNMFIENNTIKEFEKYEDIIFHWFPIRRDLYKLRLERQLILLKLEILYYENKLRFIEMDSTKKINIDKDLNDEERIVILENANFIKFNETNLLSPRYILTNILEKSILEFDADYSYIDKITIRMKSKKCIGELKAKLDSLRSELTEMQNKTWRTLWIDELDKFEQVVVEGCKTKWLYGTKQVVYKKAGIKRTTKKV